MDRKRLTIKYGSLIHLSCEDGYITAAGLEGEGLFIREKTEVGIDAELLPLLGFETSVFRIVAPPTSSVGKAQAPPPDSSSNGNDTILLDHFSKINTAPEITFGKPFLLVHAVSQLHVAAFPSKPSEHDPDCVKFVLVKPGEVAPTFCEFIFASRYKIHDEGDVVCRGDEVLVRLAVHTLFMHVTAPVTPTTTGESLPSEGSLLAAAPFGPGDPDDIISSSSNLGHKANTAVLEVNASEEKGIVLVVERYDIGRDQANYQRALHHISRPYVPAGVPVALYHREHECLLATSRAKPPPQQKQKQCLMNGAGGDINADPFPGSALLATRQHHSAVEGIATSRGATAAGNSGHINAAPHNSDDHDSNGADGNDDDDTDDNETNNNGISGSGAPYPLFVEGSLTGGSALNEESALDDVQCSCTALWILENEEPKVGGAVRMQSVQYRLRQACSNLYLAVTGSGVDAFFDEVGHEELTESFSEAAGVALKGGSDVGSTGNADSRGGVRATTLCMISPPRSQKDLKRTLFTVNPMFASDCTFLIENECLLLQNVLTGLYVCTQETGQRWRLSLQWQPPAHDTIIARKVRPDMESDVLFLWAQCERLCQYRDAFQALALAEQQRQSKSRLRKEEQAKEAPLLLQNKTPRSSSIFVQDDEAAKFVHSRTNRARWEEVCARTSYVALLPTIRMCQRTLSDLIRFCSMSRERNALRIEGIPISKHQRMMFDLCVHRLVFDVILAPFTLLAAAGSTVTKNHECAAGGGEASTAAPRRMAGILSWGHRQWGCNKHLPPQPLTGGVICLDDVLEEMHAEVHLVCRMAFRLLRQMVRKAPLLKAGFGEFIPYALELDGRRFHVVETLTEIFSDNANITVPLMETMVDHFIENLNRVRSAGYLQLLASMCVVEFRGIAERQALLCRRLLVENENVLCRFVLDQAGDWAIITGQGEKPVPCHVVFNMQQEQQQQQQQDRGQKLAKFVESEVDLLSRLCFDGCPPECCAEVAKVFPPDVMLEVVQKFLWTGAEVMGRPSPYDVLRGHLLRLAVQCYIVPRISDPAVQLRASTVLFGSSQLRVRVEGSMPFSGSPDDELTRAVKFATLALIRSNPHFVQSDMHRSVLLRTCVNAWLRFVSSHQITSAEVGCIIPPLQSLLDGTKDVVDDNSSRLAAHIRTRLEVSEASVLVMRTREMICTTLLKLLEGAAHRAADEIILFLHEALASGNREAFRQHHDALGPAVEVQSNERCALLECDGSWCGVFGSRRGGYQSINSDAEMMGVGIDTHGGGSGSLIDPKEVVDYLNCVCGSITQQFHVKDLIPWLMDLVRYDSAKLTAQATELLVRLCVVERIVAHRVLLVHTLPSIEVTRNFDHLYTVAVRLQTLCRSGCVDEAVATALESIEANRTQPHDTSTGADAKGPDNATADVTTNDDDDYIGEEKEELGLYASDVDEAAEEEEGEKDSGAVSVTRRGHRLLVKTAGAARMLAYRSTIRRRRRSVGLSETSTTPLRLVIRAEMVCHWRIHVTLLRLHASIDPSSPTFFKWMRFFYLFTLSRSNARALWPHMALFMSSLTLNAESTVMCLHIIVAILATVADPTPYLTTTFLRECVRHLDSEVAQRCPDDEFASQLSASIFAKPVVGGVARRRMLQLLRDHNTLRCLPRPGAGVASYGSGFIASMVELLCHICGASMSALAMGRRALPMQNIFALIMECGTAYSPLRSATQRRSGSERKAFHLVGTYLRALVSLYIAAGEEEGGHGKAQRKMEWMANSEWWAVVQMLSDRLCGLTRLIVADKGRVENRGLRVLQRYRQVWLVSLPVALLTFVAEYFLEAGFYRYQDSLEPTFRSMCDSITRFCQELLAHADAIELHVREVVNYRRLNAVLQEQVKNIAGLDDVASSLGRTRNQLRAWLIRYNEKSEQQQRQQKQSDIWEGVERSEEWDENFGTQDILLAGEGVSKRLQESPAAAASAGLLLSSAVTRCRDVEQVRSVLRTFIKRDVLIPVEDSEDANKPAGVVNELLRRSPEHTSTRDYVANAMDGMRKGVFSPMAFVGLLNCFHNALYAALNEKKQDQHHQQQQQQQQQTQKSGEKNIRGDGEEDAGYVLQLTFSDLGMTHVVASLCAVDDEVMTYSATRLGVVLLDGGNQRAQRALLNYFETHQEGFFHNIRDVLQKALRWVWRLNVEQQLVILERGGVIVNVSNLQHFMSMLLANVPIQSTDGGGSSSSSSINTNDRRRLSGWDRVQGCLRVRLIFTLFRMLQLFCEGHNLSMQNYIRSQHDNMHSVNLVHEVMVFLAEISTIIRPATVEVVRGGFELLTELCQGPCHANQEVLLSYDVCATICHVLDLLGSPEVAGTARTAATRNRSNNNTDPDASDLVAQCDRCLTKTDVGCLRTSLTTCLLSLTEGCRSPDTIRRILAQIPVEIIERELATVGPKMYDRILDDEEFEDDPGVEAFFKWLVFLHTVRPFAEGLYQQHVDEMLRRTAKISSRLLGHIEVRRADGQLEKVLFRIPLSCCGLTQSTKDGVLWSVNRTSRATKLGDFLHQSDNLIFEVERAHAFQRWVARWTRFRLGGSDSDDKMGEEEEEKEGRLDAVKRGWNRFIAPVLFSSQLSFYEYASIAVAVIVNTSLISVEGARWNDGMVLFWKDMLTFLCFLQFVLSCIVLGVDAVIFFPVCLYTEYRRKQHLTSGRAKLNATMQEVFDGMTVKEIVKLFFTRFTIQFRLFLVIMAALSVLVSHYFAAAHLLLVIYKTPTLRTFISAITQNGRQLLLTAFLGVVVLYLFAIVGYLVFSRGFGNEEGTNEENCGTLLRCFTFILWQGLRQGGGVGDVMEEESWTSTTFLPRVSYDLIFFALVNVVFLNIMFGLIIDTFGELRDDKREKETDMRSTCFICGLDAERFEKARIGGFRAHVNQEHNMWMYLYFMSYLRRKDPNDFTGQESYVHERIQQNDLGFFPEEECLLLQEDEDRLDAAEDEQQDVAGVDERGTARRGPAAAAATAAGGGADAQAVALTLKELAGAKEALSVFVRDIGADAQKVKTMLRQLEITSRSIQGTSVNGAGTQGTRSVTGTHVSKEGS